MIKVRIQRAHMEVSSQELSQIDKAFNLAIDRFRHILREVEVTLEDVNGPRGGVDKCCRVQLRLFPRGLLVVKSSGASLMEAVNEACDKVRQVIARRLSKQKSRTQPRLVNQISELALHMN